eukprot:s1076_g11.t1
MAASHSFRKRRVWPLILLGAIGTQRTFVPTAKSDSSVRTLAAPRGNSPAAALAVTPLLLSTPAFAQEEAGIASAFVAYGHYLGLVLSAACLVTERLTVKAGMTREEEQRLQVADAVYGLAAVLIVVTGYLRVTQYGKGWEFYQHEPIFWVKLSLIAVTGAVSFFVTTTVVKRAIAQNEAGDKDIAPVSEKLANRMTSVINAQLLAIGSIPLAATLMARGAFYADWLPWQAGAFPAALLLVGLGFRYVKEALDWTDDEPRA